MAPKVITDEGIKLLSEQGREKHNYYFLHGFQVQKLEAKQIVQTSLLAQVNDFQLCLSLYHKKMISASMEASQNL